MLNNGSHRVKLRFLPRILIFPIVALAILLLWQPRTAPRANGPLAQDAYVWNRAWVGPVQEAITTHATNFTSLVVLAAEVSWANREPRVVRVALDHAALRNTSRPVGLALRIGPYSGPFGSDDRLTRWLADLASSIVVEARTNGLSVAELQIDFDCAESKLGGYRV